MEFQVGDFVEVFSIAAGSARPIGYRGIITKIIFGIAYLDNGNGAYIEGIRLVNNNKNMSSIKEKFTLAFKKEPEKTFRKAGITNGDDFLTEEGQSIFLAYLLKKFGEDFKKEVVDDLVGEVDEPKK